MAARSKARKRAVDVLYEADIRSGDAVALLRERLTGEDAPPVNEHTVRLVEGVAEHGDAHRRADRHPRVQLVDRPAA